MKRTIFLSLPMRDRKFDDIINTIEGMKRIIMAMYPNDELEFISNFEGLADGRYRAPLAPEDITNKPIYYLGKAMEKMSRCDHIAVIENHNCALYEYRGCYIEAEVARNYGLHFITINDYDGSILIPDIKTKVDAQCKLQLKEEVCGNSAKPI